MPRVKSASWYGALAMAGTLSALFWLERRYPLRNVKPEPDYRRVPKNLAMAALTASVVSLFERPIVEPASKLAERRKIGLLPFLKLKPAMEKAMGVILMDYGLYWWHILLHRVPFLWRSHRVHHTDLVLDSTTALRFHWLEFLASIPWRLAQVTILGIGPATLRLWQQLTFIEVLFHHSNLKLPIPLERWLGCFIMTPRLHGIHHSILAQERDTNFSSGLVIWDIFHDTLKTDTPQEDIEIGVSSPHSPEKLGLGNLLMLPFVQKEFDRKREQGGSADNERDKSRPSRI